MSENEHKEMELPKKTKDLHNHHMDSTIWDDFKYRDDDVVVSTYAKSGTTWTQQIVGQLLYGPDPELAIGKLSPWIELPLPERSVKLAMVEGQTHRRFIKTHLPLDCLVFSPKAKYIYVARDGRDICWSLHNHHFHATVGWYSALNDRPGRVGPPIGRATPDVLEYWKEWFENDGMPFWSLWDNVRTWWQARHLPNVLFLHFNNLKSDMGGEMRKIAKFLDVEVEEEKWPELEKYCSFAWMKENGGGVIVNIENMWSGGSKTFINKGTNGRWRDLLPAEESKRYEERAIAELGEECAHWLATGELPEGEQ